MSGIIHQTRGGTPLHKLLRAACIAAPVSALIVYSQYEPRTPPVAPSPVAAADAVQVQPSPPPAVQAPTVAAARPAPFTPFQPGASRQGSESAPAADFATRNAGIDIRQLTATQPQTARTFLTEVALAPGPKGGFVVADVMPDSRYEHLGVRPGDVIYSLDSASAPSVDEGSMIALMTRAEIHLDVYRNGTLVHLRHSLASPPEADRAGGQ